MFWNVFLAQQTKILKQRIVWIELVLLAGLVALISAAPYIVGDQNAAGSRNLSLTREVADLVATMGEATIGGLLVVILAGTATAQEYSWAVAVPARITTRRPPIVASPIVATRSATSRVRLRLRLPAAFWSPTM